MSRFVSAASLMAVLACVSAHAAPPNITYVVTRTDDPVPDGCRPRDCSLREAVTAAGGYPTHDIVQLGAGTYILKSTLVVHDSVSITGLGAATTRITTTAALNPALQIDESLPVWFQLHDLSLNAGGGYELRGRADSCITFDGVELPNPAGKVWVEYAYGCGTWISESHVAGMVAISGSIDVAITDSTFGKLTVLQTHAGNPTPYTTTLDNVTVDGAAYAASGLRIGSIGDVTIDDSTVQNTRYGLRIEEDTPSLLVNRLHYLSNSEPLEITRDALALIRDSDFVQNRALDGAEQPGALWVRGGQAIVQVERSTFDGNRGTADAGGAALVENGAALVFNQSTFSGNTVSAAAATDGARGGAVGYHGSAAQTILRLIGVTVVAPDFVAAGLDGTAIGGYGSVGQVQLRVYNSVIQGSCASGTVLDHAEGSILTGSGSCGFDAATNILHATKAQLALGALDHHGGATRTFLPAAASIARDAGTDYGCLGVASDQRGYARRSGTACDAGSVEIGSSAP